MQHTGNLIITAENAGAYAGLVEVTGDLSIDADAKLDALTSVGGDLYIRADAKLDALTSVGGDLSIGADAKLDALTSVGGDLYIRADAKLDALTSVGGDLSIGADAKLDALTSVGGDLYIGADAKLDALTSVGGDLSIDAGRRLAAPRLTHVSNHPLPDGATARARLRDVAAAALVSDDALDMTRWHRPGCATTHCIAGWAIHQAGPEGYKLEQATSPGAAGAILLGLEAAHMFHASNADAREWLKWLKRQLEVA